MRVLQPFARAYVAWNTYLPRVRGRGAIIRAVDWLQAHGFSPPIVTGEDGVKLELGTDYVSRSLYFHNYWEPEETTLLRSVTPRGGTFIDVGANIGYFTLLASRWVGPSGRVYALEPVSATHVRLQRNLVLNAIGNVTAVKAGASSAPGTGEIGLESDAGHSHLLTASTQSVRQETITLTTVDDLVASNALDRVDVLKIDVEGADFEVLLGAEKTLRTYQPVVLMEVELIARFNRSIGEVQRFLSHVGYDSELLAHRSASDLLCRPRRR